MWKALLLLANLGSLRLAWRLFLDRRVPLRLKLIPPGALLYVISPFDFLPDILPVLGRVDDVLVLLLALFLFVRLASRALLRHPTDAKTSAKRQDEKVIEGSFRFTDD